MNQKNLLKILFVEDVPSDVDLAILELRKEKLIFEHTTVCTRADLLNALKNFNPDLIISDYMMPAFNGLQALKEVLKFNPELPFILLTGSVNEETAVECIKSGAQDYVIKEHMTRLPFAVREALEQVRVNKEKKASELLLRDNEEKLQSIFTAAPVGIGLMVDRILIEVNDAFCSMTGYSRREFIGKSSEIIYSSNEEFINAGKEKFRQIEEKGTGSVETTFKCKDGRIINVILNIAPLDKDDLSKGVTFTVMDLTARKITEELLRKSEERFRALYDDAVVGLYRTNSSGIILLANRALIEMLRFQSFEELASINLNSSEIGTTGTTQDRKKFIELIESKGMVKDLESIWICRDGNEIFVRESAKLIRDSDGEILYYDGTVEDITDKKKAEKELKSSYSILNASLESTADGILIVDGKGGIIRWNQKFAKMWGLPGEILNGHDDNAAINYILDQLTNPDKFVEIVKDLYSNPEKSSFDRLEFKDGRVFERYSQPQKIDDKVVGRVWSFRDVTDRIKAEEALILSEKKYRRIFENVQDVYYETSLDGIILEVSPSIYLLSKGQYNFNDLTGRSMEEFYSELKERQVILSQLQTKGSVTDFEVTFKNHDGSPVPCSISAKIVFDASGHPEKIIGSMHDITDRKNVVEALKLAKEKAETSDRLKTEFLNNISHEVRTPLNGILGFAEIISMPDLSEQEKKDSIAMLFESSNRLLNTVTNYMDISLIASGSLTVNKKDCSPAEILKRIYNNFETVCKNKHLDFVLEIPGQSENLVMNSDPEVCQKIISHLIDNAIKFTEKGSIHFGFNLLSGKIEFFVKDTGIGINMDSFNTIFDRFVKDSQNPYKKSEGSGLGLSISQGMSEAIGGKIRLDSKQGAGSCFFLTIPVKTDIETHLSDVSVKDNKEVAKGSLILIAEDDETNFYYLNALLTRETGASILHAVNGREAIDLFKANRGIKLILMDIKMPEIDGFEATRQIKLIDKNVHIIAITAYAMSGDEERILAAGCDGYLSKPLNRKNLLEKVGEYIKI